MTDVTPQAPDATAIAVLPYGKRLGRLSPDMPLDELRWPLGRPGRLDGGRLCDLGPDDHLICYPGSSVWLKRVWPLRARVTLMITEPRAIHGRHMMLARLFHRRFWRVLSCNKALVDAIPNGVFFPVGTSWVPDWETLDTSKTAMLSLIASAKRDQTGHKLRHEMVDWLRAEGIDADIMGRGYRPFEAKAEGLAPYRYSLVIENVREPSYFTEKLVDALLCRTVPIYWGAPDIGRFFDASGMIICTDLAGMQAAVRGLSAQDYAARAGVIERNRAVAAGYADVEANAARAVLASL